MKHLFLANRMQELPGTEQDIADNDFWKKIVKGILTPQQNEKYLDYLKAQKAARIDTKINAFVGLMQLKLALSDEQAKNIR